MLKSASAEIRRAKRKRGRRQVGRDRGCSDAWKARASAREILHAMSEENVETVRRVYEGVNARLEAPRELFDPDYEFDNTELWPDIVEALGFEAAQEAMRSTGKRSRLTTSRSMR
jgi:hypothetical protein